MKATSFAAIMTLSAAAATLSCCTSDSLIEGDGEGTVKFKVSINSDVSVTTRATGEDLDELLNDFKLYVYSSKGLVRKYHSQSELPTDGLALMSGQYQAYLWAGDSTAASYTHRYFAGSESFTITAGSSETVSLVGALQNAVASVDYDESVDEAITSATMTIGTTAGTLDFAYAASDSLKGYYMLTTDSTLVWQLEATMSDGTQVSKSGSVTGAKSATEYQFVVTYNSTDGSLGGLSVTVDETTVDVEQTIVLTAAPKITGNGFDISQTVGATEAGFTSNLEIYVAAAARLTSLTLDLDEATWQALTSMSGTYSIDLLSASSVMLAMMKTYGLYMPSSTDEDGAGCGYDEENDEEIEKIVVTSTLLNTLSAGTYSITITATDTTAKSASAVLTLLISSGSEKVVTEEPTSVRQVSATLAATIVDTSASGLGFQYRAQDATEWTTSTDVEISGTAMTLTVTDLTPGATYEYCAIATGFTADTLTFTTNENFQMPDSDFETWVTETPYLVGDGTYWDTGNHGSSTLGANVTTPDSTYKNSGNYSAKLASQFVGISLGSIKIGKFAAGNIFTGQYLATVGVSGAALGFGQPFTQDDGPRPTALHGYVRYESGTVDYDCDYISTGDSDIGSIYIAMLDSTTEAYESYGSYPIIIDTTNEKYFSSTADNVMGYGSLEFTSSTSGDGMVEFEIPITYTVSGMPSNILVVAAASKYGDYFGGSTSSVMWVDDFELIYE